MKILSIGLDKSILEEESELVKRVRQYGALVEEYDVIVPYSLVMENVISNNVRAYGSGGGNKVVQFLKIYYKAKELVKNNNYDLITTQDQYFTGVLGLILARKLKKRLEIQVHGWEKRRSVRVWLAKLILPRADSIRTVSKRLSGDLIKNFNVNEDRITVVPIYVDVESSEYFSQVSGLKDKNDKFIFITVGRLVEVKNIDLQINIMKDLVEDYHNIELWIVGDGKEKNRLKKKISDDGLEKNIKILGWKKKAQLSELYKESDCFLLTSNHEGWGMVVIEAMSFGLPAIMTDVGCAGEVVKNGENGLVIPINDNVKLIESMKEVMGNNELREKLSNNAIKTVSQLPNKNDILNLYLKSWQKALEK